MNRSMMFIVRKKNISRSRKPGPEAKKVAQSAERQNQSGKDSGDPNHPHRLLTGKSART